MYLIEITADCREPLADMRSLRLEEAEVRIEDVMGHIVMKFYETVQIIEIGCIPLLAQVVTLSMYGCNVRSLPL